jgi:hypothetical protein
MSNLVEINYEDFKISVKSPDFNGLVSYLTKKNGGFYGMGQAIGGFDTAAMTGDVPDNPYLSFCEKDIKDDLTIVLAQEVTSDITGYIKRRQTKSQTSCCETCKKNPSWRSFASWSQRKKIIILLA